MVGYSEPESKTHPWQVVRSTVSSDPWARGVWVFLPAWFVLAVLYALDPSAARGPLAWAELSMLVWVLISLGRGTQSLAHDNERRFWGDLAVACGSLTFLQVQKVLPQEWRQALPEGTVPLLFGVFYLALVLAIERRVHRRTEWQITGYERLLSWPGVLIFVLGSVMYFLMLPNPLSMQSAAAMLLSLDLYLWCTLCYLVLSTRAQRWRVLYGLLAGAAGCLTVSDLLGWLRGTVWWHTAAPADQGLLRCLAAMLLILAVRTRHFRFPAREALDTLLPEGNPSGPAGRSLTMALFFPTVHFVGYGTGLFDAALRDRREALVLSCSLALALIGVAQQRLLRRRIHRRKAEMQQYEEDLRNSEQDLRFMVEKSHAAEQLDLSDQKFFEAFRTSPDVMAISSQAEGRLIEVNRSFADVLGRDHDELIGQTTQDIGLWTDPEKRRAMLRQLGADGRVRDFELRLETASGGPRTLLLSVEPLKIDGEECLLSVAHDFTEHRAVDTALARQRLALDAADVAVLVLDPEGRLSYWNRRVEELCGWSADDLAARPVDEILRMEHGSLPSVAELDREKGWRGPAELLTRRRGSLSMHTWWTAVAEGADGPPRSKLVLGAAVDPDA